MRDIVLRSRTTASGVPALVVAALGVLTIATVRVLQARGYNPCELCLEERTPYYVGVPIALIVGFAAKRMSPSQVRAGYVALGLVFAAGAVLGTYHTGVEWKFWPGPSECSGTAAAPADVGDFLKALRTVTVVRCDEAALQVLGLSLAAWNALLSIAFATLCGLGWRRAA